MRKPSEDPMAIGLDLPGESGEHQLRNQEVFYGKRAQTDPEVSVGSGASGAEQRRDAA